MRLFPAVAIALLIFAVPAVADTNVSGTISSGTTWTLGGSPYIVTGEVIVNTHVTLAIDPGVTVKFNGGQQLMINGTLSAVGTAASPIVFTSSSPIPSNGSWVGRNSPVAVSALRLVT